MAPRTILSLLGGLLLSCNGPDETTTVQDFDCDPTESGCVININVTGETVFPFDEYSVDSSAFPRCEALISKDPTLLLLSGATANKFKVTLEGVGDAATTGPDVWYREFEQICSDAGDIAGNRRTGTTGDIPVGCAGTLSFTTQSVPDATTIFNVTMAAQQDPSTEAIINEAQAYRVQDWENTLGLTPDGCWMIFTPETPIHNDMLWLAAIYGMHHFNAPAYLEYTDDCGELVQVLIHSLVLEVSSPDPADTQAFIDFMNDPTLNTGFSVLNLTIASVGYVSIDGVPHTYDSQAGVDAPSQCPTNVWSLGGNPLGIIDPDGSAQVFHLDEMAALFADREVTLSFSN